MHAGNVFAALVSWLVAKREGGKVILRIEDLDPDRSRQEYADQIMDDLAWLGLEWDGPVFYQSQRTDIYEEALSLLENRGLIYPCYCTRADLHAANAPHETDGTAVYPGLCRNLTEAERAKKALTRNPALRLMVPAEGEAAGRIRFHDVLQGEVECELATSVGDFIVRRSDGAFAYQLAVVVDDLLQGVTLTVRGCDLLESTPQQLYLRRLLVDAGFGNAPMTSAIVASEAVSPAPESQLRFCHVPLIVNAEGKRLSKRDHDCDMGYLRERFGTPDALFGHLARLTGVIVDEGDTGRHIALDELLDCFALDPLKLRWALEWKL